VSIRGGRVRRQDDGSASEREDVMTMMMCDTSRQYDAERIMTAGERRRADEQAGQQAAEVARLWQRYLTRPARALRAMRVPGVTIGG
jgi:hypothetical protein